MACATHSIRGIGIDRMVSRSLTLQPLTVESFRPFGHVIAAPADPGRLYHGDLIENRRPQARLDLSLATIAESTLPFPLRLFERHAFSSQAFVPLDVACYLVTVCPDNGAGQPDPSRAIAFIARSDQAVVYAPGTWHHPMAVLERPGRFAIVMWVVNDADDEELIPLDDRMMITERKGAELLP